VSGATASRWPALAALALGTFATGTESHVVIGVLAPIARTMAVSDSQAGQLVTAYAVAYALLAPLCGWLVGTIGRRAGALMAVAIFASGNLACALAGSYEALMLGRVVAGWGAAMFVPAAFAIATELVPESRRGVALSVVFGGMTVASAMGVPLGTYAARFFDWHGIFAVLALVTLGTLGLLAILLPPLARPAPAGLRARLAPLASPGVTGALAITIVSVGAEFTFYSYISIAFADAAALLPFVLLAFGIGSILGNLAVDVLTDRYVPRSILLAALTTQAMLLPLLYLARHQPVPAVSIALGWGIVSYMYLVPVQHRLLALAPEAGPLVLALNSSGIYVGIAGGGAIGGATLALAGVASLPLLAAGIGLCGAALAWRRFPRAAS
jgi:predicted MFS family arabinose efflux permease